MFYSLKEKFSHFVPGSVSFIALEILFNFFGGLSTASGNSADQHNHLSYIKCSVVIFLDSIIAAHVYLIWEVYLRLFREFPCIFYDGGDCR